MEALGAAAAAVERMTDEYEPPVDPTDADAGRGHLPSDDEEGPPEVDDDVDALPPGDLVDVGLDDVDSAAERDPPTDLRAQLAGSLSAPALPADKVVRERLKVAELKEHLMWRGRPVSGNKPDLLARLEQAVANDDAVLSFEEFRERYGQGVAQLQAATAAAQWEPVDPSMITRPVFIGPERFLPNPALGFTPSTHPFVYMNTFYPKCVRDTEVDNSKRYRGWIKAMFKEIYPNAEDPTTRLNSLAHATLLLQGLNPVPDQRKMWCTSFAYKSHRGADLLTCDEWKAWKAFFHISHPGHAPRFGTREWDEMHKVRPLLDAYLEACLNSVKAGRKFSIDEITIGFQGHHSRLKMRCGKYKRAGDGFQADALVLEGGYVLFLVFRGDNTVPIFEKTFSPLHNRCITLLSKLLLDGHEGYWDNLYPNRDVVQAFAAGAEYQAAVPAGPKAGETIRAKVPATGTCGTARTNRGIPAACRQPNPKSDKMSQKAIDELKAKPIEERMKSLMTKTEPRVICASVFDNGPVHMLDTIHVSAGVITIHKPRYDAATKSKRPVPLRILAIIDDYNHNMNNVDRRDHISHEYNFDGGFWRDIKWWMPVFKELFKSACDQGWVVYKCVCELAEEQRQKEEKEQQEAAAAREERSGGSPSARTRGAALRAAKRIEAISHLDFLEKIAEGFVIEAYNSMKDQKKPDTHMRLEAYSLQQLERACAEMRGKEAPSSQAQGERGQPGSSASASGMKGGKAVKRRIDVSAGPRTPCLPTRLTCTYSSFADRERRHVANGVTRDRGEARPR